MTDELQYLRLPRGEVCTQGAQILRFRGPDDRDVLFVSSASRFEAGKPIRGGIPVIFPWFGEDPQGKGKAHGVVRRREWKVVESATDLAAGRVCLETEDGSKTRKEWDHGFRLRLSAEMGTELRIAASVENTGTTTYPFEFSLHTYIAVGDVTQIRIHGLEGAACVDHLKGALRTVQPNEPVRITGESERFFHGTDATVVVDDPVFGRRIELAKRGLRSTLVWHPGQEKAASMSDLAAAEWDKMVCVEQALVRDDAITLAPGARHDMQVVVRVLPRQ
jgi:D-hexose-6-phosphate mutarotase